MGFVLSGSISTFPAKIINAVILHLLGILTVYKHNSLKEARFLYFVSKNKPGKVTEIVLSRRWKSHRVHECLYRCVGDFYGQLLNFIT